MPIFEYQCKHCGKVSEILVKGSHDQPVCECGCTDMQKLISAFAVTDGHTGSQSSCADGSCSLSQSPCASGMCGL